jgi:hypothetical protein
VAAALTIHGKSPMPISIIIEEGRHMIGMGRTAFVPTDASYYPDLSRVWLPEPAPGTPYEDIPSLNPALLAVLDKLAKKTKSSGADIFHTTKGIAYSIRPGDPAVPSIRGIVMGMRRSDNAERYPSW